MKKILVIDDAATVRLYHRNILEAQGWAVDEAANGLEALEKALCERYDLFVVDVNMPKVDGYAFLQQFRQEPVPQAPAIMVSTESQPADEARAFRAGANLYMVKPSRPELLAGVCGLMMGVAA